MRAGRPNVSSRGKLTIVIVRKFGRITSHEVAGFWFVLLGLLIIGLAATTTILALQNRHLHSERQRLLAQLILPSGRPVAERTRVKETPAESPEKAPVEAPLAQAKPEAGPSPGPAAETDPAKPTATTTPAAQTAAPASPPTSAPAKPEAAPEPQSIEVQAVKILQLGRPQGIKISFKLVNGLPGGQRASGYCFVIGRNKSVQPPVFVPFPAEAELNGDRPVKHKQGAYFAIQNYKTLRGRIYNSSDFEDVLILVYDQEGRVLLEQVIEVPGA